MKGLPKEWRYQVIELDLHEKAIIDSDTVKPYLRLRERWSKDLALELVKLMKNINALRRDLEKLGVEVSKLKTKANRPQRRVEYG